MRDSVGSDGAQCDLVLSDYDPVTLRARVGERERRGSVFMPFHFREAAANLLTLDALDPDGKIPGFKFCAVRVEPAPE